jgi:hypothetical protein
MLHMCYTAMLSITTAAAAADKMQLYEVQEDKERQ